MERENIVDTVLSKFFASCRLDYALNFSPIVARFVQICVQRLGEFQVRNFNRQLCVLVMRTETFIYTYIYS